MFGQISIYDVFYPLFYGHCIDLKGIISEQHQGDRQNAGKSVAGKYSCFGKEDFSAGIVRPGLDSIENSLNFALTIIPEVAVCP